MKNNRREFLRTISLFPLMSAFPDSFGSDVFHLTETGEYIAKMKRLGMVRIKTPKDFEKSPFGIGCETLDRDLWKPSEIYPWMENLPVKWARLQTGWARVEKARGKYDWAWLDESVDGLIQRGFKPFFNVGYGNPNYTEGDTGYYPLISEEAMVAWKEFVTKLTIRYKDRIQYYEIWNEPNLKGFWKPGEPDPVKYVKLVTETAEVIHAQFEEAKIIGGVVSRLPFSYVRALFDNGLGDIIDIFSFHPYGVLPEEYNGPVKELRSLIDEYNPSVKIWQGENGFPSQPNSSGYVGEAPWTENVQAKFMLRRLLLDCSLGIDMSLWFLIVDIHDYPKGTGRINYKGILKVLPEVQPKVAFKALQNLGSIVNGEVKAIDANILCMAGEEFLSEKKGNAGHKAREILADQISSFLLQTDNGTVLVYWDSVKISDTCRTVPIDLEMTETTFAGFQKPVLINLLSGEIFDLRRNVVKPENQRQEKEREGFLIFRDLPLNDFPMLIVEKDKVMQT